MIGTILVVDGSGRFGGIAARLALALAALAGCAVASATEFPSRRDLREGIPDICPCVIRDPWDDREAEPLPAFTRIAPRTRSGPRPPQAPSGYG